MKISRKLWFVVSALTFTIAVAGAQSLKVSVYKNLPADPDPQSGEYTLFSLAKGVTVPLKEFESDKWDLGFKGTSIIVNGGKERKGKGGAFIADAAFDAVDRLPENPAWATDESEGKTAIPSGSGNGWYEYLFMTHEIKPLSNKVIFVKTGDGKYAKVEILSYYRDVEGETDSPGRYYTFRYVYQPDGSGGLK